MYYLRLNVTSVNNWYWCEGTQGWTRNCKEATLFDTEMQAEASKAYAESIYPRSEEILVLKKS